MDMIKYLAVPYKEKGRDLAGVDCYGFARLVLAEQGIELPAYDFEGTGNERGKALELINAEKRELPADFNLIYLSSPGQAEHVGVFVDGAVWQMRQDGVTSRPWKRIKGQVKGIYEVL